MVRSMTGFGGANAVIDGFDITVELKSVNHRYFEFSARLPRGYLFLEEKLKSFLQNKIGRGKVDISVSVFSTGNLGAEVELNRELALSYLTAMRTANESLGLRDDLSLSTLLRFPDVFCVRKSENNEELITTAVLETTEKALNSFLEMREREGSRLVKDIDSRLSFIEEQLPKIEALSEQTVAAYRTRLYEKLLEVLSSNSIDESRIVTEAAIFADKTAIMEETVRLRSHISQFRHILSGNEAVGRKLDFLVQELNREINTIGSKSQDIAVSSIVVDIKAEIEKIREQLQNLE